MSELSKIHFVNNRDNDLKICFEPWCHEYFVKKGEKVEIIGKGNFDQETCVIIYYENYIQIYGWSESMELFIDGKKREIDFN